MKPTKEQLKAAVDHLLLQDRTHRPGPKLRAYQRRVAEWHVQLMWEVIAPIVREQTLEEVDRADYIYTPGGLR